MIYVICMICLVANISVKLPNSVQYINGKMHLLGTRVFTGPGVYRNDLLKIAYFLHINIYDRCMSLITQICSFNTYDNNKVYFVNFVFSTVYPE